MLGAPIQAEFSRCVSTSFLVASSVSLSLVAPAARSEYSKYADLNWSFRAK
jgi:hypothetical protein